MAIYAARSPALSANLNSDEVLIECLIRGLFIKIRSSVALTGGPKFGFSLWLDCRAARKDSAVVD